MKNIILVLNLILSVSTAIAEVLPHTTIVAPDDSPRDKNVREKAVDLPGKEKRHKADEVTQLLSSFAGEWQLSFGKPIEEEKEAAKNLLIQRTFKKSKSIFGEDEGGIDFLSIDPKTRKTKKGNLPVLSMDNCTGHDDDHGLNASDIYVERHNVCWIEEIKEGKAKKIIALSTWESGPKGWFGALPADQHSADESTLEIDSDGKLRVTHRTFDYIRRKFSSKQFVYERKKTE